jgi:hypothetical protein
MTIFTFIYRFGRAGTSTQSASSGGRRLSRLVARHRLTEEERSNLRDYYRHDRSVTGDYHRLPRRPSQA